MATVFWTGKLSLSTKILVNLNCLIAFFIGNTRKHQAMKNRVMLGYDGQISDCIKQYDNVGLKHYTKAAELLINAVDIKDKTVLDVGCGTGIASFLALDKGSAHKVLGIDISENMIRECQKKAKNRELNNDKAAFRKLDAEDLDFSDDSFDIVLSGLMLGFAPNPAKVIKEIVRVLKPGGTIAISAHRTEHYWEACDAAFRAAGKRYLFGYRMEFWPRKERYIKHLLIDAGLREIKIQTHTWHENLESPEKAYGFFAATSGLWWYAKLPAEKILEDSHRICERFKKIKLQRITSDIIIGYGRK